MVKGSVEGVIIAERIAEDKITIRQFEIIVSAVKIPKDPSMNCKTGSWNAIAVLAINKSTKSKYRSIDQAGSTISAPKLIKKLIAAGTKTHQENNNPRKNNSPDPATAGIRKRFSFLVSPGVINNIIW